MEQKKKIIAVIVLAVALVVGMILLKGSSGTKLSGTYKAEHWSYYSSLPDEFVFENGYCDIGSFTCTYEYKNGTLYFYWGNAVWEKYKCSINGNKIVIDNDGEYVTYYKQ
ncbi:hypothetical protein RX411_03980 [Faecalibacterium prausnitzii]|jgi:hypothetical protein|uniref:hypothetical protein n=1 Tax=Faecalibacterium prausnitzii TaxID=853 RepID=UPI00290A3E7F|nr:hypothetical protein [Faecalibacterium prausnitzii]